MQTRVSAAPFTTGNDHETHSFVRRRDRYRHGRIRCNERPGVGRDRAARAVEAALAKARSFSTAAVVSDARRRGLACDGSSKDPAYLK
jgi:hypothetical protein